MSFSNTSQASDRAAKVCHVWANQLKDFDGERGRETEWRIFCSGETLYSYGYHFPIATIHNKAEQANAVLFTNRRNSLTTNKHIRCAWDACSQYQRILCYDPLEAAKGNHDSNLMDWESKAESKVNEIARARDKESRYNSILHYYNEAKEYADYFDLTIDPLEYPNLCFRATPDALAKLKAAKDAREAKEREAKRNAIVEYNRVTAHWRAFETVNLPALSAFGKDYPAKTVDYSERFPGSDPMGFSYFRFNPNTQRIETTQRIEIPLTVAKRFLTEICPAICKGEIVKGTKILDYPLLEANKDFIRVGCHKISTEEIKRQAKAMAWEVC